VSAPPAPLRRVTAGLSEACRRIGRSLGERDYRLFFTGHSLSIVGTWMQRVGQDWLVLQLSESGVVLGVVTAMQFVPTLRAGMVGGVVVDRSDRRTVLLWTQSASALLALTLGLLTVTGAVTLPMVFCLSLGLGVVTLFDTPARHTIISDLVPVEDLVNAQALNSTIHNLGRFIGPAVAGLLIVWVGVGPAFLVNALSFVPVLAALVLMDGGRLDAAPRAARAPEQIREGLRYVWEHDELRRCMLLVAVVALFGQNFRVVLPLLARDTFGSGAAAYGWLTSALGLGAFVGALIAATRMTVRLHSLVLWTVAFGVVNLSVAGSPTLAVALVLIVGVGLVNITFNTLVRTLLQTRSAPEVRGRVIALHGLVFLGSMPIGGPLVGAMCELWGARAAFVVSAIATVTAAVPMLRWSRRTVDSGGPPPLSVPAPPRRLRGG
jgi:MFS family permease